MQGLTWICMPHFPWWQSSSGSFERKGTQSVSAKTNAAVLTNDAELVLPGTSLTVFSTELSSQVGRKAVITVIFVCLSISEILGTRNISQSRSDHSSDRDEDQFTFAFGQVCGAAGVAAAELQRQAQRRVPGELARVLQRVLLHHRLRLHLRATI